MKRILFFSLVAIMLSFSTWAQSNDSQDKRYMVLGVAFYNLENLFDTINNNGKYDLEFSPEGAKKWDSEKYHAKLNNMAQAIASLATEVTPLGPAIIGVSEIENRSVLDDLVKNEQIKEWQLQVIHHDSPDRRGIDVGLLYNPYYFEPLHVTNHTLVIDGDSTFRTRDQMCVTGLLSGEKVSVIVNHWPSRLGGEQRSSHLREAAAALSKHIADSVWNVDPNQAVIIMGDLNDDPFNKSCSNLLGAKKERKKVDEHGFFNPFWKTLDKGIGSLAYRGVWNLFDQIIISGNTLGGKQTGLNYLSHRVHNKDFLTQQDGKYRGYPLRTFSGVKFLNGYSDHYPTIVYFLKEVTE
ncbi:MAG: endonuclease/exonuclease/phosphatase family protein [Muribaculaceae bacterium]|nr:endonuclease/exonuclease/phosphatase family protein [Muribaculaceae bacterium]